MPTRDDIAAVLAQGAPPWLQNGPALPDFSNYQPPPGWPSPSGPMPTFNDIFPGGMINPAEGPAGGPNNLMPPGGTLQPMNPMRPRPSAPVRGNPPLPSGLQLSGGAPAQAPRPQPSPPPGGGQLVGGLDPQVWLQMYRGGR